MPTSERKLAKQLVSDGEPENFRTQWYRKLDKKDQTYVREVAREILENPRTSLQLVARNLILELSIKCDVSTVATALEEIIATTFEEMVNDVKPTQ